MLGVEFTPYNWTSDASPSDFVSHDEQLHTMKDGSSHWELYRILDPWLKTKIIECGKERQQSCGAKLCSVGWPGRMYRLYGTEVSSSHTIVNFK